VGGACPVSPAQPPAPLGAAGAAGMGLGSGNRAEPGRGARYRCGTAAPCLGCQLVSLPPELSLAPPAGPARLPPKHSTANLESVEKPCQALGEREGGREDTEMFRFFVFKTTAFVSNDLLLCGC